MVQRIWDIQWFTGGESDDVYKWPKDSFHLSNNMEVRKNLAGATLSAGLVTTGWSIDGTVLTMINLETIWGWTGIVVCTETGKIYLNGTLMTTFVSGTVAYNRVHAINVWYEWGTQYLYYFTGTSFWAGQIHRSNTSLSSFDTGSYPIAYTTATWTSGSNVSTINDGWIIYFAKNNKVLTLDAWVVSTVITFQENEIAVALTSFQNNFKIYTNKLSTGIQYIWNGVDTAPDYRQEWINQPIMGIVNNGSVDYAILWYNEFYADLYLIQGTQKQPLRVNLEASSRSRTFGGQMSIREDIVYISGGSYKDGNIVKWVFTYGNYYPWTPKSLNKQFSLSTDSFTVHTHGTSQSFYACTNGTIYKSEYNNPPTNLWYASSGYIETQVYQGNIWEKKSLNRIEIGYDINTLYATSIDIYLRNSLSNAWVLYKSIAGASLKTERGVTLTANEVSAMPSFYELQMKIVLNAGISGGVYVASPTIFRATVFMDILNK